MAGTGSNTVVAENVFVPAHRALPLPDMVDGRYPERHNSGNPYFNYPLAQVLVVNGGGTPLGIARRRARGVLRSAAGTRHHVHDVYEQVGRAGDAPPGG